MATIDSLANETLVHIMEMFKEQTMISWENHKDSPQGRYDTLRAAALVCSRWRDPAQRALFDYVYTDYHRLRITRFLASPAHLRSHTRTLRASESRWSKILAVAEVCNGLQTLAVIVGNKLSWCELARPCFAGLSRLSMVIDGLTSMPLRPDDSLPVGLSSLALWTNLDEAATAFLAAISSASSQSLKNLHLRIHKKYPGITLRPALSDVRPHLQTFVVEADPRDVLEGCLDLFPTFHALQSLSLNGLGSSRSLTAEHTANLDAILNTFLSHATLLRLSIGTDDFSSLYHILPLLGHPILAHLTKLDFPSLPLSTPAEHSSGVAAMAKACEDRGIQCSMGGVAAGH